MDIENLIKAKLENSPFINRHGGDIEFVKFKDGYVYVKMLGLPRL